MIVLYGIPNCDSIKKAKQWLAKEAIEFEFFDYKKQAPSKVLIAAWLKYLAWEDIINKRGTTYRKLSDKDKAALDNQDIALLIANPSIIKRPIWKINDTFKVGIKDDTLNEMKGLM